MKMKPLVHAPVAAALIAAAGTALAHGGDANRAERLHSAEETAFGRAGDPGQVARTVRVGMSDRMRFTPALLTVKEGETVRFRVRNGGNVLHEMVLGTLEQLKQHAEVMRRLPEMEHDEPYMAHVKPGRTETMTWTFSKPGEFYYGCLVPGHFEAGMMGRIIVQARTK